MATGEDIRFGVEIECYVPVGTRGMSAGAYHRGIQINDTPAGWNGQRDSSLHTVKVLDGRQYRPIEVVSPILSGLEGLAQVFYVVEMLQAAGAIVDEKCGLHIHVDGRSLVTEAQRERLIHEFVRFEKVFLSLNGRKARQRMHNTYCRLSDNWIGSASGDRYRSLNMTNLYRGRKGTVEFRLFAAEIDAEFIITAVYMAVAMVVKVTTAADRLDDLQDDDVTIGDRARRFVQRYLWDSTNLIISDESTADVEAVLYRQIELAGI
jgi:hypothetical protein